MTRKKIAQLIVGTIIGIVIGVVAGVLPVILGVAIPLWIGGSVGAVFGFIFGLVREEKVEDVDEVEDIQKKPRKQLKIVPGTVTCMACELRKEATVRCNKLVDGRVLCIFCGFSSAVENVCRCIFIQPMSIRRLVADLISSKVETDRLFRLVNVSNQMDGRNLFKANADLLANYQDASAINVTRLTLFGDDPSQTLTISYSPAAIDNVTEAIADELCVCIWDSKLVNMDRVPDSIRFAARKLARNGFRITGTQFDGAMRTIVSCKGSIRSELSW